jgi:putative acetyltransferase
MICTIRAEQNADVQTIRRINNEAFGQEDESRLIDAIRASEGFVPELSLIAELSGKPVGHILFSLIHIETESGSIPALSLAPMAVLPEDQRKGIGSALVRRGLDECRRSGGKIVIVLGHAEYYPRFGFVPARTSGIECPWPDVPDEAWMVLELTAGALHGVRGVARYSAAFGAV